ncbi:hypothetical protein [Spirosoma koreense]
MNTLTNRSGLVVLCFFLLATLPWACTDHPLPPTSAQLLTGCTTGWKNINQTYQGNVIGGLAPECYRLIFKTDGKLLVDRSRCTGPATSLLDLGSWSSTETTISLPSFPWNLYGIPGPHRIDLLTATTLQFSYRGDPEKITETWSCE